MTSPKDERDKPLNDRSSNDDTGEADHHNTPKKDQEVRLRVEDLHKSFGDIDVLKGVSLTARKGDVIALLGASGSGKSTFLRCINFLEKPDSGTIELHGEKVAMKKNRRGRFEPVDAKQIRRLRLRLGMVFQNFNLWSHLTVLENIIEAPVHVLGIPRPQAIEEAKALLDKVGVEQRDDYFPSKLSGGQQQRVAIARALAVHPEVMLFDEPTSALDPELVGEVLKVIKDLAHEGRTMLLVTHEMGFARDVSTQTMFLHQGKIEEQGHPSQVFGNPKSARLKQFLAAVH